MTFLKPSSDIKAKFALLREYRSAIEELTRKHNALEEELLPYFPSVAPAYKCPPEILVEIFRHYLEDNPRLVRRLMLVNKHWYHTTTGTPGLWTTIPIVVDTRNVDAQVVAKSICRRIKSCVRYSKNLPLDVSLDLGGLMGPTWWISAKEHAFHSVLPKHVKVHGVLDSVDNRNVIMSNHYPLPWSHRHVLDLFQGLKGPHDKAMERWRSLRIRLPFDRTEELDNDIVDELRGPVANLTELIIQPYSEWNSIHNTGLLAAFTDLSSLKKINLPDINIRRHHKVQFPHHIEHFEFCCWSYRDYDRLRDFTMLQTLVISCRLARVDNVVVEMDLELPKLNTITFKDGTIIPTGIQVTFPSLQRLNIIRDDPGNSYPCSFPNLDPPCLGVFLVEDVKEAKTEVSQRDLLRRIFHRYRKTKHFILSGFNVHLVGEFAGEVRTDLAVELIQLVIGWEDERLIQEWVV